MFVPCSVHVPAFENGAKILWRGILDKSVISHFRVPCTSFWKQVLVHSLSYENEFSFTCRENSFSCERFCTRPCFEKEAQDNSEMACYMLDCMMWCIIILTGVFACCTQWCYIVTKVFVYRTQWRITGYDIAHATNNNIASPGII